MKKIDWKIYVIILVIILLIVYLLINKKDNIKEELILEDNLITLEVNEERKIKASVTHNSNAKINYLSTNTLIVTVDEIGNIKGISEGEATIFVNYDNTTLPCRIVVQNKSNLLEDIIFPNEALLMGLSSNTKLTFTLDPSLPLENITFTSSNPNIVNVDTLGNVNALSLGNAKINVNAYNINKEIDVYVVDSNIESRFISIPKEILVDKDNYLLKEGNEEIINLNISNDLVSYYISNPSIVSISSGKIKALKEGKTLITIETVNGLRKEITVEVEKSTIKVDSINLTSSNTLKLSVGEKSQITYTISPEDATNKEVIFESLDNSIVNVTSDGLIIAVGNGETSVTVTTMDGTFKSIVNVSVGGGAYIGPTGKSGVNKACSGSDSRDQKFNSCFVKSHNLYLVGIGGQDSSISMNVGETKRITVRVPSECGKLKLFTRISPDGEKGWSNYVSQGYADLGSSTYTWTITAKKRGSVILSQTVQYDSEAPSGTCVGNVKSMIRLNVRIN